VVSEASLIRALLAAVLVTLAVCAIEPRPAAAADECAGLLVCVPVAGPWVPVPAPSERLHAPVHYALRCPPGYIVGGLDADLSGRSIDLSFLGILGSPVNPGISTSRRVVFVGLYTGAAAGAASFRPLIGCIPAQGGGGRETTSSTSTAAVAQASPSGVAATRRVRTVRLRAGRSQTVLHGCRPAERLVGSSHALGLYTLQAPTARQIGAVRVVRHARGEAVVADTRTTAALRNVVSELQIHALCATGEP
jgi:hypothetical protein